MWGGARWRTAQPDRGLVSLELETFSIRRDAGLVFRERAVPSHAALRVAHHLRQICDTLHSEN